MAVPVRESSDASASRWPQAESSSRARAPWTRQRVEAAATMEPRPRGELEIRAAASAATIGAQRQGSARTRLRPRAHLSSASSFPDTGTAPSAACAGACASSGGSPVPALDCNSPRSPSGLLAAVAPLPSSRCRRSAMLSGTSGSRSGPGMLKSHARSAAAAFTRVSGLPESNAASTSPMAPLPACRSDSLRTCSSSATEITRSRTAAFPRKAATAIALPNSSGRRDGSEIPPMARLTSCRACLRQSGGALGWSAISWTSRAMSRLSVTRTSTLSLRAAAPSRWSRTSSFASPASSAGNRALILRDPSPSVAPVW
mmetsp:Transcript_5136/g.12524  ORF Transcript_5136/g.12524 Transcript_5136/m.12524 type:complete len:315 (-) Transcript_5136:1317-2261(-)